MPTGTPREMRSQGAFFPFWNCSYCSTFGNSLCLLMQIVSRKALVGFWEKHPQAKAPLEAWYAIASKVEFRNWQQIKDVFGTTADRVKDNRVIFDIGGNKYRLIVHVSYAYKSMLIKFIGTHKEYDRIDPETV